MESRKNLIFLDQVPLKQSYRGKRLDGDRMAVPSQIHRARSKIANISLVLRVGFCQVFGLSSKQRFGNRIRVLHRDETNVAVAAISASIAPATAHNSIKQPQGPRLNIRDAAWLILRHIAKSTSCERNPVGGKQGPIQTTESSLNGVISMRGTFPFNVRLEGIYRILSSRINCVRNKIRKTIVSVANQALPFAASVAFTRSYLHSRWSTN